MFGLDGITTIVDLSTAIEDVLSGFELVPDVLAVV